MSKPHLSLYTLQKISGKSGKSPV